MKNIEAKWLGGVTAETYAAGSVQFTWEDSNGNPKLEKLYYQVGEAQEGAHNLINKVQVFGIKNPSASHGEQDTYMPNKKMSEMTIDMEEVKTHVSKIK